MLTLTKMLTLTDYEKLWTDVAPNGFGQPLAVIPSYIDYLKREIYFQDYLDLFLRKKTYARIPIGGGLGVNVNDGKSNICVPVDYDYPWTDKELMQERCIKYIMAGEAPPPTIRKTYFYNTHHLANTPWLNAPVAAFSISAALHKRDKLLELANNSYILIDLFPFVYNYANIRNYFNDNGVSTHFFNEYLLKFIDDSIINKNLLCQESILAFSGPSTIHHFLAHQLAIGTVTLPLPITCRSVPNNCFIPPLPAIPPAIPPNGVPFYRCCVYTAGGYWSPGVQEISGGTSGITMKGRI